MYDHDMIEMEEEMSIAMASFERGNAMENLSVLVRIVWTPYEGIYCEPLSYVWPGHERVKLGHNGLMDTFVRRCVADNYDEACLQGILADDPNFEHVTWDIDL